MGLPGPAPPVRRRGRPRSGGVRLRTGDARPRRRPRAGVAGTACGWRRRRAARRGPRRVRGGARATRVRSGGRVAARCSDGRPPPASRAMSIAVSAAFTALGAADAQAQFGVRHRQGHPPRATAATSPTSSRASDRPAAARCRRRRRRAGAPERVRRLDGPGLEWGQRVPRPRCGIALVGRVLGIVAVGLAAAGSGGNGDGATQRAERTVDGPVTEAHRERTARALGGYRRTEDASWQTADPLGFNPRHRDRGTRRIMSRMGRWAAGQRGSGAAGLTERLRAAGQRLAERRQSLSGRCGVHRGMVCPGIRISP